ncbi:hypothetical protein ACFVUS_39200 [Nocardia sp. NPDC058058]|uniref:hypothetical protein n=1 Tax=Nocardia sp. NPDC058058 TaxID=3346317 RepID=UPI0036DBF117
MATPSKHAVDVEDVWRVSAAWLAGAEPFRGINAPPPREIDPGATEALFEILDIRSGLIADVLEATRAAGLDELADAAHEYVRDPGGEVSPIGAAAIWVIAHYEYRFCCGSTSEHWQHAEIDLTPVFIDSWISEHGLAFAAAAAVHRSGMTARQVYPDTGQRTMALEPLDPAAGGVGGRGDVAEQLRAIVAAAPEADHREVVQRLALLRSEPGTDWARLTTSYLLPEQQDWVEVDLALPGLGNSPAAARLLSSLTTATQYNRFAATAMYLYTRDEHLFNMLTQIGPRTTPVIVRRLAEAVRGANPRLIRTMSAILAELPTDEAFQGLVDHASHDEVDKALAQAMIRYPRRAIRVLSRSAARTGAPAVVHRLRLHAHIHPELVGEPGHFDPDALPLLGRAGNRVDAQAADLPMILTAPPWAKPRKKTVPPGPVSAKVPAVPAWIVPTLLPQLALRDAETALPEFAVAHLIRILAASGTTGNHVGLIEATEPIDRKSLTEFVWALFETWHFEHYPAKSGWVLHALGQFGDDETINRLAPYVKAWIYRTASARATAGLNVIATIGGATAVQELRTIARETRYSALGRRAGAIAETAAAAL